MKKCKILLLFIGLSMITMTSCLKDYLNKAPKSGLTEEDVFSKYVNSKKYFETVYTGNGNFNIKTGYPLFFDMWGKGYTWESITDMSDMGLVDMSQTIKNGQISAQISTFSYDAGARPILKAMFSSIRICNITLQNIGMLKDAKQKDIDDLIAQAHFVRAFAHFELFRLWGSMPYITTVIGKDDEWDIPRLSKYETLQKIALDMDSAAFFFEKAGEMRRDPGPGQVGHLNDPDQQRPNGVAAKAYKARALLYAASPLNNDKGQLAWEAAAKANWEAIQIAEQNSFALLSAADYKKNYVGTTYTNEQLWGWYAGTFAYNIVTMKALMNGIFGASYFTAECPTQNTVDKFETQWGDPLTTEVDRQDATSKGHYNEQNPYVNRDPRFNIDIIYNQAPLIGYGMANIFYEIKNGAPVYSELLIQSFVGITHTGYYNRKRWGEQSVKNKTTPQYTEPLIRLGELYLNYAEATNEAYGPNSPAPNSTMTAVQAINKIRNRIGMPDVLIQFTGNKDIFRTRIKNERTIELCFEGHYYHDIRRWMDAPKTMSSPLYGVDIEKVPVSTAYPTGFKYTRLPLSANRQSSWKDAMYYLPFTTADTYKMKKFIPNEAW